jgi:hypothetical protein
MCESSMSLPTSPEEQDDGSDTVTSLSCLRTLDRPGIQRLRWLRRAGWHEEEETGRQKIRWGAPPSSTFWKLLRLVDDVHLRINCGVQGQAGARVWAVAFHRQNSSSGWDVRCTSGEREKKPVGVWTSRTPRTSGEFRYHTLLAPKFFLGRKILCNMLGSLLKYSNHIASLQNLINCFHCVCCKSLVNVYILVILCNWQNDSFWVRFCKVQKSSKIIHFAVFMYQMPK